MAGNFLSSSRNQTGPSSQGAKALGSFVFWAVVATVFPYEVLTGYWPAALTWGPVILYGLALFSLIRAARQFSLALRRQKGPSAVQAARWSRRQQRPVADSGAGKQAQTSRESGREASQVTDRAAERVADRAARTATGVKPKDPMPAHTRAPTVQRMR